MVVAFIVVAGGAAYNYRTDGSIFGAKGATTDQLQPDSPVSSAETLVIPQKDGESARPMPPAPPPPLQPPTASERLVAQLKARYPKHGGSGILAIAKQSEGAGNLYEVYYTGDKAGSKCLKALRITDLPRDGRAHDPKSDISKRTGTMWDKCLDGTVDLAHTSDKFAPVGFTDTYWYERDVRGARHERSWQAQFDLTLKKKLVIRIIEP